MLIIPILGCFPSLLDLHPCLQLNIHLVESPSGCSSGTYAIIMWIKLVRSRLVFLYFWSKCVMSDKNTLSQTFAFLSLCKILTLTENICKIIDNVLSLQLFLTGYFKPWSHQRWSLNLNCNKLKFSNPCLLASLWGKPLIFQT